MPQLRSCGVTGGAQESGDCNRDGQSDLSDSVCLLGHLFLDKPAALPCGDGRATSEGNRALQDLNGSSSVDLSDAVHALNFLFSGGPPPVLGRTCTRIAGGLSVCPQQSKKEWKPGKDAMWTTSALIAMVKPMERVSLHTVAAGLGAVGLVLLTMESAVAGEAEAEKAGKRDRPALPGSGLQLKVDVDGDGASSWSDRYVFNHWLELGGSQEKALAKSKPGAKAEPGDADGVIDLGPFLTGAISALSPKAAVARSREAGAERRADAPAPPNVEAAEAGRLLGPFHQGDAQLQVACSDPRLLAGAAGQALVDGASGPAPAAGALFVARRVEGRGGGVTRLVGLDVPGDGRLPLRASEAASVADGLPWANQLAFDAREAQLIVTLAGERAEREGPSAQGAPALGQVKRLGDLLAPRASVCDEVPPGAIAHPAGVVVVDRLLCLPVTGETVDLEPQGLLIADRRGYRAFRDFGSLLAVRHPGCETRPDIRRALKGLHFPSGLALGDFQGEGAQGIYFVELLLGSPDRVIRRSSPERNAEGRCIWDAATEPAHARFRADEVPMQGQPEALVFDPHSPTLFVSDDAGGLWRIRATPGAAPIPFAEGLEAPLGVSFPRSGVMLLSAPGKLLVVDGWRFRFLRGDVDANLLVELADVIRLDLWLYLGERPPGCWDACDANDDGRIDAADSAAILRFLFEGGPSPAVPFPDPGTDPTGDLFGCARYHPSQAIGY